MLSESEIKARVEEPSRCESQTEAFLYWLKVGTRECNCSDSKARVSTFKLQNVLIYKTQRKWELP